MIFWINFFCCFLSKNFTFLFHTQSYIILVDLRFRSVPSGFFCWSSAWSLGLSWWKSCFSTHFAWVLCHKRWDALLIVLLPIMGPEKGTDKLAFCPTSLLIATKILSSKDQTFAWLQGQKIFFSITNWFRIVK